MFASCPHEITGCREDVQLSVAEGESVTFNATVIHTPGRNCDLLQEVRSIKLEKIDIDNELLYSCHVHQDAPCVVNDGRVSLSRGADSGLDFVFKLTNATKNSDVSPYEVVIEVKHPATHTLTTLKKRFHLHVNTGDHEICIDFVQCNPQV